jgi:hypothetical protein
MVELSEETYSRLLGLATSFEDTPDDVVRRLIDAQSGVGPRLQTGSVPRSGGEPEPKRERATPGSILPEREYWRPILETLVERGGSAPANDVIDEVGVRMRDQLTPRDFDELEIGETRWRNRARFARLRLREQGLLSSRSHRGIWEITPQGREYLRNS